MKANTKIGARVIGAKKAEALSGRQENQKHKSRFKSGPHAKNDPNAGRPNGPLLPLRQAAVKPARKAKS
jgi:hypothetical protein